MRTHALGRTLRGTATAIALALIIIPIAIVVITAFSPLDYFEFPPRSLSLRWFVEFQGSQLVIAAASTLQVALIIVMVAVIERIGGIGRIIRTR